MAQVTRIKFGIKITNAQSSKSNVPKFVHVIPVHFYLMILLIILLEEFFEFLFVHHTK